ncbi:MAG: MFS transporter [Bradyrhizobium sp.]|uniref:MFS transporter n=1 Tax=Bradyrhizobium sp. TaxID=376 RepID=UPI0025C45204|nr:MFS transporter [Bradyrhizobium sp.]MBI5264645.1 MFS transporter [Bradyrhizobium sp.]
MPSESQIPIASQLVSRRFAARLALFYGTVFGVLGTHLPFFPVWLKAIGIDASWIGIINAVPAVTRFTILPFVTGFAERRHALRGAMIFTTFATALGLSMVGTQYQPLALFLAYVATCCLWTPTVPLTDAYALRGVARYGLNYGPLRLWGSAAFVVGALACGLLVDVIAPRQLIWVIVAVAVLAAATSLLLQPLDDSRRRAVTAQGRDALLRDPAFLAIIVSAALVQCSHAAYYSFASINWQAQGFGGLTIAGLWTIGVLAEILVFAISPRFTLDPWILIMIGGLSAVVRWSITALEPQVAVLAIVQLGHGLTFGITQVGTMSQLVRHVPVHAMARGQGYYAAASGLLSSVASIGSGVIYARYGEAVYYVMAAMAGSGAVLIWLARHRLQPHPQSDASGGKTRLPS